MPPARFVQIATTVTSEGEFVYALDIMGVVWWLKPGDDNHWTPLTEKRQEPPLREDD